MVLFGKQPALDSLFYVLYNIYAGIYKACSLSIFFLPRKNEKEIKQKENLEVFHFFN